MKTSCAALGIVNSYSWKIQKSTSDRKTASVALFSIIVVEGHGSKRISSWYFDLYIVGRLACPDSIQFQFILFLNSLTQMKSADWKTDGFYMTPWFSLFPLPLDKPTRTLSFHIFPFCPRLRKIQQCHAGSAAPALKKDPHTATLGAPCRLQKDGDCLQPTDRPGFKRSKTALTIGLRKAGDVPGHKTIVLVLGLLSFAFWQCLYMPVYYRDISSNSLLLYYLYYLRNPARTARHNTSNH